MRRKAPWVVLGIGVLFLIIFAVGTAVAVIEMMPVKVYATWVIPFLPATIAFMMSGAFLFPWVDDEKDAPPMPRDIKTIKED